MTQRICNYRGVWSLKMFSKELDNDRKGYRKIAGPPLPITNVAKEERLTNKSTISFPFHCERHFLNFRLQYI